MLDLFKVPKTAGLHLLYENRLPTGVMLVRPLLKSGTIVEEWSA